MSDNPYQHTKLITDRFKIGTKFEEIVKDKLQPFGHCEFLGRRATTERWNELVQKLDCHCPTTQYIRFQPDLVLTNFDTKRSILIECKKIKGKYNNNSIRLDALDIYKKIEQITDIVIVCCDWHVYIPSKINLTWIFDNAETQTMQGSGHPFGIYKREWGTPFQEFFTKWSTLCK